MLTSSDAKFRCMWYMVVWSILLMFMSQFFNVTNVVAFYIFASATMLLLPLVTSIYSTTSGNHGAGLLRVSYIFCDPVLACITVIPVLLLHRLPILVEEFLCLDPSQRDNSSCVNHSSVAPASRDGLRYAGNLTTQQKLSMQNTVCRDISLIQVTLVVPALLALSMGHRTRKMSCSTVVLVACYWLLVGIETADLIAIDTIATATASLHAIVSSAAIIAIAAILSSSYAAVTLCSFISPTDDDGGPPSNSRVRRLPTFDALYRVVVAATGILFVEIPLVVVRSQVIAAANQAPAFRRLPVVFCMWLIKDSAFIAIAVVTVVLYVVKARRGKTEGMSCNSCGRMAFDNPDVFFAPEKRDTYLAQRHGLAAPGAKRDLASESQALMNEPVIDVGDVGGAKKLKKCVTFRLENPEQDGASKHRNDDDDDDDDDD